MFKFHLTATDTESAHLEYKTDSLDDAMSMWGRWLHRIRDMDLSFFEDAAIKFRRYAEASDG